MGLKLIALFSAKLSKKNAIFYCKINCKSLLFMEIGDLFLGRRGAKC
jgi:hypothetical protein